MIKSKVFQIERPWGNFRQFTQNENSTVKILTIKPNEILSLQTHSKRSEFWHVISGDGMIQIGDEKINVKVGDELEIEIGQKHRMAGGPNGMQLLEIAIGDFDEYGDIVHLEDKYGRKKLEIGE
ncbi:MAG: phosphomannose isomerase type II C-terminal cupin domain [Candidatus Paceibacterota bacterium]|jgi:mannose-1-phosphate guanylyltransferase/mannose-1-phosphate guanylyltransferase/mannose-6-phosphate isomerase